jgi:hypothetical protein
MKPGEAFEIKRTCNGEILLDDTKSIKIDKKTEKALIDAIGDYGSVTITASGGRAVKSIVKKSTKL